MAKSELEVSLIRQMIDKELAFHVQYRFHPPRRWTFDIAFPDRKIAVEVEGGSWVNGRHNRPQGFANDCEKYNTAVLDGWRVLRFVGAMVDDRTALRVIEELLSQEDFR